MAQRTYGHLLIEGPTDAVAIVTFNRPQKLNALDAQARRELAAALSDLAADGSVGAVVLTGAGDRAFCAGMDLSEAQHADPGEQPRWGSRFSEIHHTILDLDKPVVAAINGYAIGAGFQLAALCDLRVASDNARFGMLEIDDALPCIIGAYVLWHLVGRGRTAELVLTGRQIDAREALAWGIVRRVVPREQLRDVALEQARLLAAKPRTAMRMNRRWVRELLLPGYARALEFAHEAQLKAYASGEPQRAMADFLAKRRQGRSA